MSKTDSLDNPKLPSERKFGLLLIAVSLLAAGWANYKGLPVLFTDALLGVSGALCILTVLLPAWLAPVNRAWFLLGILLGRIISPIVMGIVFFLLITPVAVVTRSFGRDELRLKRRQVSSYWLDRVTDRLPAESFKDQF